MLPTEKFEAEQNDPSTVMIALGFIYLSLLAVLGLSILGAAVYVILSVMQMFGVV